MTKPTMGDLRRAGAAAALAPLAVRMTALRVEVNHQAQIEGLSMQLVAILGGRVQLAIDEAGRREAMFADVNAASIHATEHPRIAALNSVLHDAMSGRFG